MLENIMPASQTPPGKRINSAPETKTTEQQRFLPMISEETNERSSKDVNNNWHRSVTAPVQKNQKKDEDTIRVVPPSPSGAVAPLNVRKRSNESEASSSESQRQLKPMMSNDHLSRRRANDKVGRLTVIEEDTTVQQETPTVVRKKKSWFGLNKKAPNIEERKHTEPVTPEPWQDADDGKKRRPSRVLIKPLPSEKALPDDPPLSGQSSEFPIRKKRFAGGKKGFTKWLGRKAVQKDEDGGQIGEYNPRNDTRETFELTSTGDSTLMNSSLDSLFSAASPAPSSDDSPPSGGPERSWFARFFNIKPATKILCFSIPRGRARQELVLCLREWQRHGIQDLQYSRETNMITARVDKQNALDIKPVAFRIELFVVLEHGRKVGLSIARFVQVKGAASGFKRVLEVVDGVMRGRGWLVEDEEKWKALCEVVGG